MRLLYNTLRGSSLRAVAIQPRAPHLAFIGTNGSDERNAPHEGGRIAGFRSHPAQGFLISIIDC